MTSMSKGVNDFSSKKRDEGRGVSKIVQSCVTSYLDNPIVNRRIRKLVNDVLQILTLLKSFIHPRLGKAIP